MTSQQRADIYLAQWRLLWPLSPAERIKHMDEIVKDYEFEAELAAVNVETAKPELVA